MNRLHASKSDIWDFMSVFKYREYVIWRWKDKKGEMAKNRIIGNSDNNRNGISRLWWWAEMTIDENNSDPYHLTNNKNVTQNSIQFALDTIPPRNKKIFLH